MNKNLLFALSLSLLLLGACNSDKVTKEPTTETEKEITNTQTETETTTNHVVNESAFNFNSFSLDVEYGINDSYEVDYEVEHNGVETSIEDRNNTVIKGNEAYTKLEPIFKSFKFTSASTDQEIATEVLKAFELDENYKELEVDIHFSDGIKKEFKIKK